MKHSAVFSGASQKTSAPRYHLRNSSLAQIPCSQIKETEAERAAGTCPIFYRKQGAKLGLKPRAPSLHKGSVRCVVWALSASGT